MYWINSKESITPIGSLAQDRCPACGTDSVFYLGKLKLQRKLYSVVPVSSSTVGFTVQCRNCRSTAVIHDKAINRKLKSIVKDGNSDQVIPGYNLADLGLGAARCSKCKTTVGPFDPVCPGCGKRFR